MELTKEQNEVVKDLIYRYKTKENYSVLCGYAGVGKTTCIKFLVNYLLNDGLREEDIIFTAFTGKAVQVMIDKGNKNAITLHKLLYRTVPKKDGTFYRTPVSEEEIPYKIIICDECSMVPKDMIDLLLSYHIHTIFIGDNYQLPPINKNDDNHLLDSPHMMLTTIHRQAQDSGIIRLSMLIREGKLIDGFKSEDALVLPKTSLNTGMLQWSDQILCATNKMRNALNQQCRELRGFTKPIEENEKVICLANRWETVSKQGNALTNGCTGTLTNIFEQSWHYPWYLKVKNNQIPLITGTFTTFEGDCFGNLEFDKELLLTGNKYLSPMQEYQIRKNEKISYLIPYELAYGYAITCHKAQGSSWPKVLVIEESFPFEREEHKRWLYTAVTRSEQRAVLVR